MQLQLLLKVLAACINARSIQGSNKDIEEEKMGEKRGASVKFGMNKKIVDKECKSEKQMIWRRKKRGMKCDESGAFLPSSEPLMVCFEGLCQLCGGSRRASLMLEVVMMVAQ